MNNFEKAFQNKKAFIAFLTAGDPDADSTVRYILELERAGADLIEIGIPFSDPTAEGPVIQEASLRALRGGMNTDGVFEIAARVRKTSKVPLAFMTYLNPVFHYGYEKFFKRCQELDIGGVIIPDLPLEEKKEAEEIACQYGTAIVSLIAPTSEERIRAIAAGAKGFIYIVSSMGVTGVRKEIHTDIGSMVRAIREVTDTPCAVGFGINTPEQAQKMASAADGVIVGSAIVKLIAENGKNADRALYDYVKRMKAAIGG